MIKVDNVKVSGWESAIRGMRNAYNSWDKSDSCICFGGDGFGDCKQDVQKCPREIDDFSNDVYCIGKNDLKLMMNLANAGDDHGKFLRMITATMDITAPRYWWTQFDTYKVGSVSLSCSTMHTIAEKQFRIYDFSAEDLTLESIVEFQKYIEYLEKLRKEYLQEKAEGHEITCRIIWNNIIQLLPQSYNQTRTVLLNYQILRRMYKSRKDHKLKEWNAFRAIMETLPYSELITGERLKGENDGNI